MERRIHKKRILSAGNVITRFPRRTAGTEPLQDPVITRIDAVIRNAKGIWFLLLGVMTFSAVTILGVEDVDFFAYDRATRLPLVGVEVPVTAFFGFGAVLITAVYVYFHLYLELLWRALAKAPAQIQGEPLSEHIAPWLVSEWALRTRDWLRKAEAAERAAAPRALGWIGSLMSLALVWLLGPFVLAMFWWRSMPAHYDGMTFGLGLLFTFALFVGLRSARSAWRRLKDGHERGPARRMMRLAFGAAMTVCAIGISAASLITTASDWWPGEHAEWKDYRGGTDAADWIKLYRKRGDDHAVYWDKRWREAKSSTDKWHYFADRAYTDFFSNLIIGADLAEAQLVALPRDWLSHDEAEKEFRAEWAKREGLAYRDPFPEIPEQDVEAEFQAARLEAREQANQNPANDDEAAFDTTGFRNRWAVGKGLPAATPFAPLQARNPEQEFEQAWSARRKTWLDTQAKPILTHRNLRQSDLRSAFFPGVKLNHARLEGADLRGARLEGADLSRASLQGARLSGARLEGADLSYARLFGKAPDMLPLSQSATLRAANFPGAALRVADMTGINVAELENFSQSFGDGSVMIAKEDRPAHWCEDVLSDAEFFGRWRGHIDPNANLRNNYIFDDHPPIPPSPC